MSYDPNDICTKCKEHAYDCNCEWPGIPGAASTRTASDTRTAAGEAECDAARRAAPASQHDSYSPTIVDCDGLPKAVAAIMENPRAIVGWANLYELIDGWGQSQREHATARPAEVDVEAVRQRFEARFAGATFQRNPSGHPCDYAFEATENLWQGYLAARTQAAQKCARCKGARKWTHVEEPGDQGDEYPCMDCDAGTQADAGKDKPCA